MKRKTMRTLLCVAVVALMMTTMSVTAFAATGDVAGAVENTWNAAKSQVQTVVNNVVFPVIDMILAVLFFVKVGNAPIHTGKGYEEIQVRKRNSRIRLECLCPGRQDQTP